MLFESLSQFGKSDLQKKYFRLPYQEKLYSICQNNAT